MRDLSRSLDTDYVQEMGLQRAVEYELELIRKSGTITTQLQINGPMFRMDKQKDLILFRIMQETFNNIIKHAEARNINVTIQYKSNEVEITIFDDGKGFDTNPINAGSKTKFGLGIRNMFNRAKLIGAHFTMISTVGKGTYVTIVIPKQL